MSFNVGDTVKIVRDERADFMGNESVFVGLTATVERQTKPDEFAVRLTEVPQSVQDLFNEVEGEGSDADIAVIYMYDDELEAVAA